MSQPVAPTPPATPAQAMVAATIAAVVLVLTFFLPQPGLQTPETRITEAGEEAFSVRLSAGEEITVYSSDPDASCGRYGSGEERIEDGVTYYVVSEGTGNQPDGGAEFYNCTPATYRYATSGWLSQNNLWILRGGVTLFIAICFGHALYWSSKRPRSDS